MYRTFAVVLPLALAACTGDKDDTTTDTIDTEPTTNDSGTPVPVDLTGNFGTVIVAESKANAFNPTFYYARGLFTDDDGGLVNLAGCLFAGDACVTAYPAEGDTAAGVEDFDFFYGAEFFDVDSSIEVGDTSLARQAGSIVFYAGTPTALAGGTGVTFDGDFAPYAGTDDFGFAGSIEALAPDPLSVLVLSPSSPPLEFAWTPGAVGDVLLDVNNKVTHLADDGTESVAVATLGFEGPLDVGSVTLARSTVSEFDASGNTVKVQTRSNQTYPVTYTDFAGLTELAVGVNAAEDCTGALALPSIGAGTYYGNSAASTDDHDLGNGNPMTNVASPGNDVVVPITLLAGQTLAVDYLQVIDAAAYLLPASCSEAAAVAGSDYYYYFTPEKFEYVAAANETVYLVLDGFFESGDYFTVDLAITGP